MKAEIVQRAHELGFDACRFTTAAPPASAAPFQVWLAGGQHGEMDYLQRNAHKRVDPQAVLAGAKTIVTLAVSYAEVSSSAAPHPESRSRQPATQSGAVATTPATPTTTTCWPGG